MSQPQSAVPFKEIKRYGGFMGSAGIIMREVTDLAVIEIKAFPGSEQAMFAGLERAFGITVDGTSGKNGVNDDGSMDAIWCSLNSYLITSERLSNQDLYQAVKGAVGVHAMVTDQSAGRPCFELKGNKVAALLMSEAATNLEPAFFGVGQARAISWAGISAVVSYRDGSDRARPVYWLFTGRSFAQSLWEELCDVGQEWAVQVVG